MIETLLAVLVITFAFLALFRLSHLLTGHILLEHAAMRAARARAVGYNDFMCLKAARFSIIPVAGRRLTPVGPVNEPLIANKYLQTPNGALARGLLHYERWDDFSLRLSREGEADAHLETDWFDLHGRAEVKPEYPLYMEEQGL